MTDRDGRRAYPGYDVLQKRNGPSWNEATRRAVDERLAVPREPRFFTADEFASVEAVADRIAPQPADRPRIPIAALIDHKLLSGVGDGYRPAGTPRDGEAWRQGLRALDAEARDAHGVPFRELDGAAQDALLKRMEAGDLPNEAWGTIQPGTLFKQRVAHDIVYAYYSHPTAWNEIGWGGPASPRGYVRTDYDERDPWEAAEAKGGDVEAARRRNARVR